MASRIAVILRDALFDALFDTWRGALQTSRRPESTVR